jgi:hypothetical protein
MTLAGEEPEPWRAIFAPIASGQYLFHYTRLATAVEAILPDRRIRLSRFSTMRDPRESQWAFASVFMGDVPGGDRLYWEARRNIDDAKASIRILSLTEDLPSTAAPEPFDRGYVHPRLWEQYAGDHVGVCLCFERQALTSAVSAAVAAISGVLRHGSVDYRDGEIDRRAQTFHLPTVHDRGVRPAIEAHLDEHFDELFFTKLTDWKSEVEYRYIVRWDDEGDLFVDISHALKAVVVGYAVSREYAPTLLAQGERMGVAIARMKWQNGRPFVFKFTPPPR